MVVYISTRDIIKGSRHISTFAYLYHGAFFSLENSRKSDEGKSYHCLNAIILSAFSFEAYLNHVGNKIISYWEIFEIKMNAKEKLDLMSKELHLTIDYSCRPFQSIKQLLKFRNTIAHGRLVKLQKGKIQNEINEEINMNASTIWEKVCSVSRAERYFEDTREAILKIHNKSGLIDDPFIFEEHKSQSYL